MTEFDQGLFLREMDELLQLARRRLDAIVPAVWVYTLGIYIETGRRESSIHVFRVDPQNYDKDEVALWRALDPALERVAMTARDIFGDVLLDPEAEIAINTRDSDYGRTWPLRPPAT